MEGKTKDLSNILTTEAEEILAHKDDCGIERKSMINSMLHLSFDHIENYDSGSIYLFERERIPSWCFNVGQILSDIAQKEYSDGEKQHELSPKCSCIITGINPSCDISQGNVRAARFLSGLLIPDSEVNKIKRGDDTSFIWRLGPLHFDNSTVKGIYHLILSARHFVTCNISEASKLTPLAKMRSQAFAELQAWFARHASRPGIILLK